MVGLLYLLALILSVTLVPFLMYRRMLKVRRAVYEKDLLRKQSEPPQESYVDGLRSADGTIAGQAMNFDPQLAEADKAAAGLPDIDKTLQGKR